MDSPCCPPASSDVMVRPLPPGEEARIRPLFREVFRHDISPGMLGWKYGQGRGLSWGAWDADDQLLVHCGVFYRDVLAEGQKRRAAQLGDLMASAQKPGGLARRGSPFYGLIRQVLDSLPGPDNPDGLAFGFPSDRAMRLGERLGVFMTIDQVHELAFEPLESGVTADRAVRLEKPDERFCRIADQLWTEMAGDLALGQVGVRDAAYLIHRYFEHPENPYGCYLIQSFWTRRPLGLLFIREGKDESELMDLVAPLSQVPRLLKAARQWLHRAGGGRLKLWLASEYAARFGPLAQACHPLEFRIMANPFSPPALLDRLRNRWWLTSGDTDYR